MDNRRLKDLNPDDSPRRYDPPQTWFRIDPENASVEPQPGVVRTTRTTLQWRQPGPNGFDFVIRGYRNEFFPTYTKALQALVAELRRREHDAYQKSIKAQEEHERALDLLDNAKKQLDDHKKAAELANNGNATEG